MEQKASSWAPTPLGKLTCKGSYVEREIGHLSKDINRLIQKKLNIQMDALSADYEEISIEIRTPFTSRTADADPPFNFVAPGLKLFDRSTNMREHVLWYHNYVVQLEILDDRREAMMCKMFVNILKRPTLMWYYCLKPRSINSFGELSKKFQWQFTLSMKARNEANHFF